MEDAALAPGERPDHMLHHVGSFAALNRDAAEPLPVGYPMVAPKLLALDDQLIDNIEAFVAVYPRNRVA